MNEVILYEYLITRIERFLTPTLTVSILVITGWGGRFSLRIYNLGHALLLHNIIFFFFSPLVKGIHLSSPKVCFRHSHFLFLLPPCHMFFFLRSHIHGLKVMFCLCCRVLLVCWYFFLWFMGFVLVCVKVRRICGNFHFLFVVML